METYINCLFAQIAGLTDDQFKKVRDCATSCSAESLNAVRFNHSTAASILKTVPDNLADRLSIAQRITPVLTAQLSGNPRQCKRFLNTLLIRQRMAQSQKIILDQPVLAKLMILELFRPEAFRALAKLQVCQRGVPAELTYLERSATGRQRADANTETVTDETDRRSKGKRAPKEKLDSDEASADQSLSGDSKLLVATWLADSATRDWLVAAPALAAVDLRPYFFFARDKLGAFGEAAQRMSQIAQQLLVDLTGESDSIRSAALERSTELNPADATGVFETLADRARAETDSGATNSSLSRLFQLVTARADLFGQLVSLLGSMPDVRIAPTYVLKIKRLAQSNGQENLGRAIIEKWSGGITNRTLSNAAKEALKPRTT